MRVWILVSALLLSPAAMSQTPPPAGQKEKGQVLVDRRVFLDANGKPVEGEARERILQQLRALDPSNVNPPTVCEADYSDITAEKTASDEHFRAMRGKVVPLQHQYEQELYYRDRRAKRYEETCGRPPKRKGVTGMPDPNEMTMQACKAIGVVCKPMKHW